MKIKNIFILFPMLVCVALVFSHSSFALDLTEFDDYLNPNDSKTISMDFKNAQLNDVLKIFSQQSGLNFIASTDVSSRTINLYLDKVPVEEALERILSANNLTYELNPTRNIFVVKRLEQLDTKLVTRVYQLKHATVPSSKLNSTFSASENTTESTEETSSTASGIVSALTALLTTSGKIIEDPRTNSLLVTDVPSQFPVIEQALARLDIRIPQILIEVEMLDISKNTAELLGAKFGDTPVAFNGASKQGLFPFDFSNISNDNIAEHIPGARDALFEDPRYETSKTSFTGLTFLLQFLRTRTDTKNLARPRILTLNNETAEISVQTDEAIGIESTSSDTTGTITAEAERAQTGVSLRVTPQANTQTGEITLALEPNVAQARTGQTFGNIDFKDPESRVTRSVLRVHDGDTVILGGLLRTDETNTKTRVPVLGEIPLLGMAFRHKDNTQTERELIIFITPHILKETFETHIASRKNAQLIREQRIPKTRQRAIDEELSLFETQRF